MPDRSENHFLHWKNLLLKLFPATVANADIECLKSLHTLFDDKYLNNMLVQIWTNLHGPNYTKSWAFWQKTGVLKKCFWQSVDAIFEDVAVAETIV